MNTTAKITSNTRVTKKYETRTDPQRKRFFDESPKKSSVSVKRSKLVTTGENQVMGTGKENAQSNTRASEADNSPFKTLAGRVYGGQGHAASGIFTPSNLMWSPNGDSDLFSPGTLALLQASPTTTAAPVRHSVRIAFSLSCEFKENAGYSSDSEKSDLSGITDPMSTSSSDGNFFQLSDTDEDSRDSFSSNGASKSSADVGDFNEKDITLLYDLGFDFDGI